MAILIDPPAWPAHDTLWSHLVSDADYEELHAFAAVLGAPRRGFDLDHYDVPASLYERAIELGALPVSAKDVVHRLRDSGLRVRKAEREAARPVRRRQYLVAEWSLLGQALGFADPGVPVAARRAGSRGIAHVELQSVPGAELEDRWHRTGDNLIARWNEPHRLYHDERHLEDVLLALNHLAVRGERLSPETLLAAWFHDAVYRGDAGSDEEASARLAVDELTALGLESTLVQFVGELIVDTTPGREITDPAASLAHLLDADLSIFAASPERYERYTTAVRKEYAHVSDADFAAGRARILTAYLGQPTIYRTAAAQRLWEERARMNLAREIAELTR